MLPRYSSPALSSPEASIQYFHSGRLIDSLFCMYGNNKHLFHEQKRIVHAGSRVYWRIWEKFLWAMFVDSMLHSAAPNFGT